MRQHYGPGGVPMDIDGDPAEPAAAWRSHRQRLRAWLQQLPDAQWTRDTRCPLWDVTLLARHLASGSQFLGYTLHMASQGTATTRLRDFEPHTTVQQAAAMLGELTPTSARGMIGQMDAAVEMGITARQHGGWDDVAEAPPGHLPAHLSLSHFLSDSWVHEHDLLLPGGQTPVIDPLEVAVVVRYLMGLAVVTTEADVPLAVRLHDPELLVGVDPSGSRVRVTTGSAPSGAVVVEGGLADVVDLSTGRKTTGVEGDARGIAALRAFGQVMAG